MKYNPDSKTHVKLNIPTMITVLWIRIMIMQETNDTMKLNIPTKGKVQWIQIMIAKHQWNYETKHTNYDYSNMNYNHDSKTQMTLWNWTYQLGGKYNELKSW